MPNKTARRRRRRKKTFSLTPKSKKRFKKISLVVTLFVVSIIGLFTFITYQNLTRPFVAASSVESYDVVDLDIYTVAIIYVDTLSEDFVNVTSVEVLFMDKKAEQVAVYELPATMEFKMPGRYSYEPLEKVISFGKLHTDGELLSGIDLLVEALSMHFAHNIDRYVVVDGNLTDNFEDFVFDYNHSYLLDTKFLSNLTRGVVTNATFNELKYTHSLINIFSSSESAKDASPQAIDTHLQGMSYDSRLALEKKSVSVLNGVGTPGLASFGSRVVKNAGGRVISVGNAIDTYDESMLIVDDSSSSTVQYISRFFNIPAERILLKTEAHGIYEPEVNRSDIVLILGDAN